MRFVSRRRLVFAVSATIVAVILVACSMATMLMRREELSVSLRELIDSPEKYLGERLTTFTITKVLFREDPYHRLNETYYLVHIRDSYEYEVSFVVSSDQHPRYAARIGENVRFKLTGALGPGIVAPPNRLITNILVAKSVDPYAREFCTIRIALAEG